MAIETFKDKATESIYSGRSLKGINHLVQRSARRKMRHLEAAEVLEDLRSPPGNRLEKLQDHRAGQYSIRVNDQYRICFLWDQGRAYDVELVDYHDENRRGR